MPEILLEAAEVAEGPVRLLAPVTHRVPAGQVLALRGDNGSGKTTLLRLLAGWRRPTRGTVRIGDLRPDERSAELRRCVSSLLGPPAMTAELTVHEHLVLVDASWGGDAETCDARSLAAMEELGIAHLADRFPHELSSGQRQLAHLVLVLFRPASVVLLDEPEQRLDGERRRLVADILRRRQEAGCSIVLATHDGELARAVADDELWLSSADD